MDVEFDLAVVELAGGADARDGAAGGAEVEALVGEVGDFPDGGLGVVGAAGSVGAGREREGFGGELDGGKEGGADEFGVGICDGAGVGVWRTV